CLTMKKLVLTFTIGAACVGVYWPLSSRGDALSQRAKHPVVQTSSATYKLSDRAAGSTAPQPPLAEQRTPVAPQQFEPARPAVAPELASADDAAQSPQPTLARRPADERAAEPRPSARVVVRKISDQPAVAEDESAPSRNPENQDAAASEAPSGDVPAGDEPTSEGDATAASVAPGSAVNVEAGATEEDANPEANTEAMPSSEDDEAPPATPATEENAPSASDKMPSNDVAPFSADSRLEDVALSILQRAKRPANEPQQLPLDDGEEPIDRRQEMEKLHCANPLGRSVFGPGWLVSAAAADFCHPPLYFEEANLERHGRSRGFLQPAVSGARFFGTIPALPYLMTVHSPRCCYDWNHPYKAGFMAPRVRELPPFSWKAAAVEASVLTGFFLVLP
ncbi:MAG: hypothetical protein ACKPEY_12730, partial [Planctomycetota bacterium]